MVSRYRNWFSYFESMCFEYNLGNEWKVRNISRLLKGRICVEYINNIMFLQDRKKLKYKIIEIYFICDDENLRFVTMKVNMVKIMLLLSRIILLMVVHFLMIMVMLLVVKFLGKILMKVRKILI